MRIIGIDLGTKRIGLAVCDRTGAVAVPLAVLPRSRSRRHDHSEIARIAEENEAGAIVVGLPLNMDGSRGPAARSAEAEATEIGSATGLPVHLYDERLTTVTAERVLREAGVDSRDRRKVIDKIAAAVLLQSWIDAGKVDGP